MKDFMTLGPTPTGEDCAQVGSGNYYEQSIKECEAFIAQLRRQFGTEPILTRLSIKTFPHDFGCYREVVCYYDDEDEEATKFAFNLESNTPEYWDDEAKKQLGIFAYKYDTTDCFEHPKDCDCPNCIEDRACQAEHEMESYLEQKQEQEKESEQRYLNNG